MPRRARRPESRDGTQRRALGRLAALLGVLAAPGSGVEDTDCYTNVVDVGDEAMVREWAATFAQNLTFVTKVGQACQAPGAHRNETGRNFTFFTEPYRNVCFLPHDASLSAAFPEGFCLLGVQEASQLTGFGSCFCPEEGSTSLPTVKPSASPTMAPSFAPTLSPSTGPTTMPTGSPTASPVQSALGVQVQGLKVEFGPDTAFLPGPTSTFRVLRGTAEGWPTPLHNAQAAVRDTTAAPTRDDSVEQQEPPLGLPLQTAPRSDTYSETFQVRFRCYLRFLLEEKVNEDGSRVAFNVPIYLDPSRSLWDFMPILQFNETCVEEGAGPCDVWFTLGREGTPPTDSPTPHPSQLPSPSPSLSPTSAPSLAPSFAPIGNGTNATNPTNSTGGGNTTDPAVSNVPTLAPSASPSITTVNATGGTNDTDIVLQQDLPSAAPTISPTAGPSMTPSSSPSTAPSEAPSKGPSAAPTPEPSPAPTEPPTTPRPTLERRFPLSEFLSELLEGSIVGGDIFFLLDTGTWRVVRPQNGGDESEGEGEPGTTITIEEEVEIFPGLEVGTWVTEEEVAYLEAFAQAECPRFNMSAAPTASPTRSAGVNGSNTAAPTSEREESDGSAYLAALVAVPIALTLFGASCWSKGLCKRAVRVCRRGGPLRGWSSGSLRHGPEVNPVRAQVEAVFKDLEIDVSSLVLGPVIGHGANGRIFKAQYCGSDVAVKELFPNLLDRQVAAGDGQGEGLEAMIDPKDQIWREVRNLRLLRHPHVIQMYGCSQARSADTGQWRFLVVMELASCSLRELIEEPDFGHGLPFTWNELGLVQKISLLKDICAGLAYIHDSNMIHFDIKPENILLNQAGQAKICDLGIAKVYQGPNQTMNITLSAMGGTPPYMAPELLRGVMDQVSTAVDVYAFGIVMWQMMHPEDSPYPKHWTVAKLFNEVMVCDYRPQISPDVHPDLAALMTMCWDPDYRLRPAFHRVNAGLSAALESLEGTGPKRTHFGSMDDSDAELQVGFSAFFWEHTQRRFVRCLVRQKTYDQNSPRTLFDIELERDDIIFRKLPDGVAVHFDEESWQESGGWSSSEPAKNAHAGSRDTMSSLHSGRTDMSSSIHERVAHGEEAGDPPAQGEVAESSAQQPPPPPPSTTSSAVLEAAYEQSGSESEGEGEGEGEGPQPQVVEGTLVLNKHNQWLMLHRRVEGRFLRSERDAVMRDCVFTSLPKLAVAHFSEILRSNTSHFQTLNMTIARSDDKLLSGTNLTMLFESEAEPQSAPSTEFSTSSPADEGPLSSMAASVFLDAGDPSGSGLVSIEMSEAARDRAFESDKMALCRFAALSARNVTGYQRVHCSATIHLPTFVVVALKGLSLVGTHDEALEMVSRVLATWAPLYEEAERALGADASAHDRVAKREFTLCPQLCAMYGCFLDVTEQCVCVLTEYMDGGSLQDVLELEVGPRYVDSAKTARLHLTAVVEGTQPETASYDEDGTGATVDFTVHSNAVFEESTLAAMAKPVLEALRFLHERGHVHGSVSPGNILLNSRGAAKLGDFASSSTGECSEALGDRLFSSPEQLAGKTATPASDIWSLMLTLLTAAIGHHPLHLRAPDVAGKEALEFFMRELEALCPLQVPEELPFPAPAGYAASYRTTLCFSPEFRDFVQSGLHFDAAPRKTATEMLAHPWLVAFAKEPVPLQRSIGPEAEAKLASDMANTVLQRVIGSMGSRKYLLWPGCEIPNRIVLRDASLARMARQLGLSIEMVADSFVYNASLAGIGRGDHTKDAAVEVAPAAAQQDEGGGMPSLKLDISP